MFLWDRIGEVVSLLRRLVRIEVDGRRQVETNVLISAGPLARRPQTPRLCMGLELRRTASPACSDNRHASRAPTARCSSTTGDAEVLRTIHLLRHTAFKETGR